MLDQDRVLAVPESAVIDTGSQSLRALVLRLRARLSQLPGGSPAQPGHNTGAV